MVVNIALILVAFYRSAAAYELDQLLPAHTPRDCACASWASQALSAAMFASPEVRRSAGAYCALPAKQQLPNLAADQHSVLDGWCYCANASSTKWYTYCDPPADNPSQINLLVVNATSVVVSFVSNDDGARAAAIPMAQLRLCNDRGEGVLLMGFSEMYTQPGVTRRLSYHSVTLSGLQERTCYEYRVRSGPMADTAGEWSDWHDFTSLYSSGITRFAIYADMGAFPNEKSKFLPATARQNIGNLVSDLRGGLIDFAIHSGDHAYEFARYSGQRGDGYMDAYSKFLSHAPWAPGWGNHEYEEGDRGNRLANITAGLIAEKRLGFGDHHRMHYSVDVGLVHVLHLDLSPYYCNYPGCIADYNCGMPDEYVKNESELKDPVTRYDFRAYRERTLAFARDDLAQVQRSITPWVIVTAHYPMYETYDTQDPANLARESASLGGAARAWNRRERRTSPREERLIPEMRHAIADVEPLLKEFRVDMYMAGHNHNYEVTWPVYKNITQQKSYNYPDAPIHLTSGAAGPPSQDNFQKLAPDWSRSPRLEINSYSRITIWDQDTMQLEQIKNADGSVVDTFNVTRRSSEYLA